ncbi:pyrroline-5-carboxylate reductase family protein [Paenirhodobacter populi]|uniref:Pyrroline-5-carboxylate reductase n=1 Tax=Paenirhodobacter populi TaxID=2306993 RepID=A0A443JB31_9RHOB|nr:pyrroline-5-carboxylate reductase dimerization domain-containing protein [Sinirhodobacter populi]RWR17702.1 NADP oxidoreductase [Sinirhodobacter populi]
MRIGIIGATGWLGSALGGRLLASGHAPGNLILLNRSGPRADYHGYPDVVWARDVDELAAASDLIVLSIRPEDWAALKLHAPDRLVVSFMAGVGIDRLAPCGARIVRAMPNAAAEIGASYSPWVAGPGVTDADRAAVTRLLSVIGTSDELTGESQIDLMSAVPGSGAAYPALLALAIIGFLRDRGITEDIAIRAAEAVVCDGARLLKGQVGQSAEMIAAYLDYQGTTAAGIHAARDAGFTESITAALTAATAKARHLG